MVKSERCSGDTGISLRVLVHFPAGLQKPGSTDEPGLSPWTAATRHDGKRVNEPLGTASLETRIHVHSTALGYLFRYTFSDKTMAAPVVFVSILYGTYT